MTDSLQANWTSADSMTSHSGKATRCLYGPIVFGFSRVPSSNYHQEEHVQRRHTFLYAKNFPFNSFFRFEIKPLRP